MGKDIIMSHIKRVIDASPGDGHGQIDEVRAAAAVFELGQLSPVVDTVTGEVLGYEFKIVVKKHEKAVRPDA